VQREVLREELRGRGGVGGGVEKCGDREANKDGSGQEGEVKGGRGRLCGMN
jgi:hypothetical protein